MVGEVVSKFFVDCSDLEDAIRQFPLVSDIPRDEWGAPTWEIGTDNSWRNDSIYRMPIHLPKTNEQCNEKHGMNRVQFAEQKMTEAVELFLQNEVPMFYKDQFSITEAGLMYMAAHGMLPDEAESGGVYVNVSW
jgi:hypothetical protein